MEDKYKVKERQKFKQIFGFEAPVCNSSLALGKFKLDILKFDSMIPGYDSEECTFEGKPKYSLNMVIEEKYGKRAKQLVESLI